MGYAAIAAAVIATVATISSSRSASRQAALQSGIALQQAERAEQQAKLDEHNVRRQNSANLASIRARFGASGIDPSKGTALLVQEDGAGVGEVDALTVRSVGFDRAAQFRNQAALTTMRAREARRQVMFSSGTKLLNAAG